MLFAGFRVFVFKLQVDAKNVVRRNLFARIQFFSRCVRGFFVGLIRDSCRECLLVRVVGGGQHAMGETTRLLCWL